MRPSRAPLPSKGHCRASLTAALCRPGSVGAADRDARELKHKNEFEKETRDAAATIAACEDAAGKETRYRELASREWPRHRDPDNATISRR